MTIRNQLDRIESELVALLDEVRLLKARAEAEWPHPDAEPIGPPTLKMAAPFVAPTVGARPSVPPPSALEPTMEGDPSGPSTPDAVPLGRIEVAQARARGDARGHLRRRAATATPSPASVVARPEDESERTHRLAELPHPDATEGEAEDLELDAPALENDGAAASLPPPDRAAGRYRFVSEPPTPPKDSDRRS